MKTFIAIILAFIISTSVFAQIPQKLSYQSVVRNSSDQLITNQMVGMKISILQGSATGIIVYMETHNPTTNANGLTSIEIGNGTVLNGDFSTIDWSNGPYFIKTETDPTGGTNYSISGTSQLLSVPYALHAKTAESITGPISESDPVFSVSPASGISNIDITSWNNKLDTEVDGSVSNEIQVLSINNDTIYLSNGGFVKLPAGFSGDYNDLTNTPTNVSQFTNDAGYLTSVPPSTFGYPEMTSASYYIYPISPMRTIRCALYESNGNPYSGVITMTISMYSSIVSSTPIWAEVLTITVNNGYFSIEPGNSVPGYDDLFVQNSELYLEFSVGAETLSPRLKMTGSDFSSFAKVAGEVDWSNVTNTPTIPTNTSDLINNSGFITNPNDADADPTNELQLLSLSNDTVYLSNGGFIKLPGSFSGNYNDLTNKPKSATYRWATFTSYEQVSGWAFGNDASFFGGVNPSSWTDGNYQAHQMSPDKELLRTLFTQKGYAGKNAMIMNDDWMSFSSTNGKVVMALFRIKNTTSTTLIWTPYFYFSAYNAWGEMASVAINGTSVYNASNSGSANISIAIPPNRVSTVIFVSTSGAPASGMRNCRLAFYNNCLMLPAGLEFVDDLETATGGWDQ